MSPEHIFPPHAVTLGVPDKAEEAAARRYLEDHGPQCNPPYVTVCPNGHWRVPDPPTKQLACGICGAGGDGPEQWVTLPSLVEFASEHNRLVEQHRALKRRFSARYLDELKAETGPGDVC